jgi:hypothetical protein
MAKLNFVNVFTVPHPKTVPVMKLPVSFRQICEVFPELSDMYVGNFIDWSGAGEYNGLYHSYRCVSGAKLTLLDAFRAVERIAKALCPDRPPSVQVIHFTEEEGTQPARKVTPQHLPLRKFT